MRRAALVVVFLVALAVAAIAFLPASLVDGRIGAATGGRLRVADASGTLWNGQGTLADAAGTWRVPFAWRIDPLGVVRGRHEVTLAPVAGNTVPTGTVGVLGDIPFARDLALELPASAFATLLPGRIVTALSGTVSLSAPSLRLDPAAPEGTLDARWTQARLAAANTVADLGTVRLAVRPQGGGLAGTLANDGGDIRIDGTLAYTAPTLAIDTTLLPLPGAPPALAQLLATLGNAADGGRVRLAWRGNVR